MSASTKLVLGLLFAGLMVLSRPQFALGQDAQAEAARRQEEENRRQQEQEQRRQQEEQRRQQEQEQRRQQEEQRRQQEEEQRRQQREQEEQQRRQQEEQQRQQRQAAEDAQRQQQQQQNDDAARRQQQEQQEAQRRQQQDNDERQRQQQLQQQNNPAPAPPPVAAPPAPAPAPAGPVLVLPPAGRPGVAFGRPIPPGFGRFPGPVLPGPVLPGPVLPGPALPEPAHPVRRVVAPPVTVIWTGKPLNEILQHLADAADGAEDPKINATILKHLNIISDAGDGSVAAIKNDKVQWPPSFTQKTFQARRAQIDKLMTKLIKEVRAGEADPKDIDDAHGKILALRLELREQIRHLSPSEYMRANHFANDLNAAVEALRQPDAGNFFNGKYAPRGKTVAELVQFMKEKKLKFAPALESDQPAYVAFYKELAAYDQSLQASE